MRYVCVLIAIIVILESPLADACRCPQPSVATAAARAKVAFVGTITKVHENKKCDPKHPTWCTSTFTYDLTVEGVFKGSVAKTVTINTGHGRGDCSSGSLGKDVENTRWLVFSSSTKEPLFNHLCGGTQRATEKSIAVVTKKLGAPKAPSP